MISREERLAGVHPDLVRVVMRAAERLDVMVLEGVRTVDQERQLIAQGHSALRDPTRCRHVPCATPLGPLGHAVDLGVMVSVDYKWRLSWKWPLYVAIAAEMKRAAADLKVPIEWGGDWPRLRDGPHFQLPWAQYPAGK